MTRTLIVYLHGIGDNIMLTGVLSEYHRLHPDEMIDLIVLNAGCAAIWQGNPLVNSVTIYPAGQPHFWNPAMFYLSHKTTIQRYISELNQDGRYARVLFPTIQTLPEIIYHLTGTYGRHKIDRLAQELGVAKKLFPYDLHTTTEDQATAQATLSRLGGKRLMVLHPFSGHAKKRISPQGIDQILRSSQAMGFTTLVVGSPAEKARLDPRWKGESVFGLSLGTLIEILKNAEVFAGTDSAVAHLAAFANTSRIIIFSPKLKPSRYEPISERSKITIIPIKQGQEDRSLEQFRRVLANEPCATGHRYPLAGP